ncbi:hypothetical protein D3C87_1635540 [compost metagenome]
MGPVPMLQHRSPQRVIARQVNQKRMELFVGTRPGIEVIVRQSKVHCVGGR